MRKSILSLMMILLLVGCKYKYTKITTEKLEATEKTSNTIGTYIETYKDTMPEDMQRKNEASLSRLILNEDRSCLFIYNNCDAMYVVTANYEVTDDKIILEGGGHMDYFFNDLLNKANSFDDEIEAKLSFTIVSNDEIYPNFEVGCTFGYDDYQKGYTSFMKEG